MPSITRLATPIIRSQTPPLWLAAGGLHTISQPNFSRSARAPTKLAPWSHLNNFTGPRKATRRLNEFKKLSVPRVYKTSKCTALQFKLVNKMSYLFSSRLPDFTTKDPKQSAAHSRKGGLCESLSLGRSLIFLGTWVWSQFTTCYACSD